HGVAQLHREDTFRGTRVFPALPMDAAASPPRVSPIRRRERPDRERGPDVRARTVADRTVSRARAAVLRGEPIAVPEARRRQRRPIAPRYVRLLLGVRVDHLRHRPRARDDRNDDLLGGVVLAESGYHSAT